MKKRVLSILTVAVAVLVVASGLAAQVTDTTTQTVTGTVVSSTPTSLVIETEAGARQTFMVDSSSSLPTGLTAGTRISVDFHSLAGGQSHAARATTLGAALTEPATTTARPVDPAPVTETAPASEPAPATRTTLDTPAAPATDTSSTSSRSPKMPDTASPLPLAGLVGLLSLAGGAAVRRFRRQA